MVMLPAVEMIAEPYLMTGTGSGIGVVVVIS
jgi:hypothetical protein